MAAIHQTAVARTAVGRAKSKWTDESGQSVKYFCLLSDNANILNQSVYSCNNEYAGSGWCANNASLSQLTLLTFRDSTSTFYFIRDLDQLLSEKNATGT